MANYVGRYRTNYFHVSSEKAFDEWMEQYVSVMAYFKGMN